MLAASALLLLASSTSTHAQLLADAASGDADGARGLCDGVDLLGPAVDLLRGKHIRVLETTWFPFAVPDEAAPHGWSGFDIDLLSAVSEYLGFTFEVTEGGPLLEDETCVSRATPTQHSLFLCASERPQLFASRVRQTPITSCARSRRPTCGRAGGCAPNPA